MATASDDFNRADGGVGANWTALAGTFTIVSNTARQTATNEQYYATRYTATAPATNDHEAEIDCQSNNSTIGWGPGVRLQAGAVSGYLFVGFGGDSLYLVRVDATVENILDTGSAFTSSTTFNVRVRANGSAIEGFRNDVSDATATDSTYSSGGWGMSSFDAANSANRFADNFLAADLAAPSPFPLPDVVNDLRRNAVYRM